MKTLLAWPRTRRPNRVHPARRWRPALEGLERRDLPSLTSLLAVAAGAGGGPQVTLLDRATGGVVRSFFAYDQAFTGGVRTAVADMNGAGPGGGPQVRVFDGAALAQGTATLQSAFFAYDPGFNGGVNVAATDLNADGHADIVTGPGAGGGPQVRIFDGLTGKFLNAFFAYDPAFTGGVQVGAFSVDNFGRAGILTAPGAGGGMDVRIFDAPGGVPQALYSAFTPGFTGGGFVAASGLPAALSQVTGGAVGNFFSTTTPTTGTPLLTLNLNPLDVNLLGLRVQTNQITVTVTPEAGGGKLLGNVLTIASNLVNFQGVNAALNNVLGSVVSLVNSASLLVNTIINPGPFSNSTTTATTPVLDAFIAPVHLYLLGAHVDTTPIHLTITAQSGNGLILGNAVTALANTF